MSAIERLKQERKDFRKNKPQGFSAKPLTKKNGELDLFQWKCTIMGLPNSNYEGAIYNIKLVFKENYPSTPPLVIFTPSIFHVNVYTDGTVCLDIVGEKWKPTISVVTILKALQVFLVEPNIKSPASSEAFELYTKSVNEYNKRVRKEALKYKEK